jgi:hypothetical protein
MKSPSPLRTSNSATSLMRVFTRFYKVHASYQNPKDLRLATTFAQPISAMRKFWKRKQGSRWRTMHLSNPNLEAPVSLEDGVIRKCIEIRITRKRIDNDASADPNSIAMAKPCNWDPLMHEKPDGDPSFRADISAVRPGADSISDDGSSTLVDTRSPSTLTPSSQLSSFDRDPSCWRALTPIFSGRETHSRGKSR